MVPDLISLESKPPGPESQLCHVRPGDRGKLLNLPGSVSSTLQLEGSGSTCLRGLEERSAMKRPGAQDRAWHAQ